MPRLLIVKLGAIGDVVMTLPAANAMHVQGYEVHWICGLTAAPVLSLYPWIRVIPVDEKKLLHSGKLSTLRTILALWKAIPKGAFDVCATLYFDSRYKLLTWPVRARRKVILAHGDRSTDLLPGRHHTDEYFRILSGHADDVTPQQLAPVLAMGLPKSPIASTGKPRIVIVPAGAKNLLRDDALRRWPIENYVAIADALVKLGAEVVLAGGPDDQWATPHFAHLAVTNVIGQHKLLETLALLDSAVLTITHDTGPLHLAGITRTALIGIFGPTDPRGRLPQRENTVALWGGEGFACRPCYDGRNYAPCTNNACMAQITPAMVLAEAQTLLAAIRSKQPLPPRIRTPKHTPPLALTNVVMPS